MSHGTPTDPGVAKDPKGGQPSGTPENRSVADETGRRTEPALRLALEAGEIGVWEWDIGTGVVRWSDNLERIHGARARQLRRYVRVVPGDGPSGRSRAGGERAPRLHRGARQLRDRVSLGGQRRRRPLDARQGAGAVGRQGRAVSDDRRLLDITKRKQAEEAVSRANRRKDEFLAMVSHELRNPLGVILNASTLIGHLTSRDPDLSKASAAIRRQTDQLARIVDDLMDVSRLSAGQADAGADQRRPGGAGPSLRPRLRRSPPVRSAIATSCAAPERT